VYNFVKVEFFAKTLSLFSTLAYLTAIVIKEVGLTKLKEQHLGCPQPTRSNLANWKLKNFEEAKKQVEDQQ